MAEWDWAKTYERFQNFKLEDDDEESKPKNMEEFLERSRSQGDQLMGHYHDHHEERIFLTKMRNCDTASSIVCMVTLFMRKVYC